MFGLSKKEREEQRRAECFAQQAERSYKEILEAEARERYLDKLEQDMILILTREPKKPKKTSNPLMGLAAWMPDTERFFKRELGALVREISYVAAQDAIAVAIAKGKKAKK